MAQKTVPYTQLAAVALQVMAGASVPANDETLAMVTTTRVFLRQIASGELLIMGQPISDEEKVAQVSGSDGVIPAPKVRKP